MNQASILAKALSFTGKFRHANTGNVAVIFAIAIVPIIGFIGAAVDYSRVNNARTAMQTALDSAALMISKDAAGLTAAQITTKAQGYFNALYVHPEASGISVSALYTPNTGSGATIVMTGSGTMPTTFLKVAGYPQIDFSVGSTTTWGSAKLRVALALDNTGSMASDGKIGALRTAATNLINQLSATSTTDGDVMISIVPFAKDVNMGSTNYNQNWIDWTDWEAEAPDLQGSSNKPSNWSSYGPGSNCPWNMRTDGFTCVSGPGSTTAVSKIPSSGTNKGMICPGPDPTSSYGYAYHFLINGCYDSVGTSSYTHTWRPNSHSLWSGCLTDRTQSYDTLNTAPVPGTTATLFPAEQYYENNESYCTTGNSPQLQPIIPLSYDWSNLKSSISTMQPTGGTNQPIGLAWGWQSLMQTAPFNAPAENANYTYNRVIILLSDGLNTEDRWPSYGNGSTQNTCAGNVGCIDARQKILCDNIKAVIDPKTNKPAYTIYTIQVNTGSPADPTSSVLQYCASDAGKFTQVTSANQIISTFDSIGTSLSKLRVAR